MKKTLFVMTIVLMSTFPVSATLVDYQFDDDLGTDWQSVAQTGTDPGQWNFNLAEAQTDGLGNAHFTGITKDWTRRHVLGSTLTSGIVTLEYNLSNWDIADSELGSGLNFGFDSGVKIRVDVQTDAQLRRNLRIQSSGSEYTTKVIYGVADRDGAGKGWELALRAVVDLDNGTYSTMWKRSYETEWWYLTTDGTSAGPISEIRLNVEGTTPWAAGDFIDVDYVTLDVIPEPATLALLGLGGLLSLRRKSK